MGHCDCHTNWDCGERLSTVLPAHPSKSDEISHYRAFVNALPYGSYLYAMFAESQGMVEQEIRNDFAFPPLPELRKQHAQELQDLRSLEQKKAELEKTVRAAEQRLASLAREESRTREALEDLRKQARRLAGI